MQYATAMEEGRIADAKDASAALMAAALKDAQEHPTPDLLRSLLANKAENDGEWDVAEHIFRENLENASRLTDPEIRAGCRVTPLLELARIARWKGDYDRAYGLASAAVESARV